MHVVDHKWVFKIKLEADGTLQKLKAKPVAKGFGKGVLEFVWVSLDIVGGCFQGGVVVYLYEWVEKKSDCGGETFLAIVIERANEARARN